MAPGWDQIPELIDRWLVKSAAPAWDIRCTLAGITTDGGVIVYWNPEVDQAGCYACDSGQKQAQDLALVKRAVKQAVGDAIQDKPLSVQEINTNSWVKVGYSPTFRRLGEWLNFFPGTYPGGIPNHPTPLASILTGGLVGAGLGYGLGWLGERFLPEEWTRGHTRRSLALIGGLLGVAPGLLRAYIALRRGKNLLDSSDVEGPPLYSRNTILDVYKHSFDNHFGKELLNTLNRPITVDNNIDIRKMGDILQQSDAKPALTAATMGTLYAAQRLPDPKAHPGMVTPHQTGLFGTMLGTAGGGLKGYVVGRLVGKTLGALTGMPPETQRVFSNAGAALSVIRLALPKLFR